MPCKRSSQLSYTPIECSACIQPLLKRTAKIDACLLSTKPRPNIGLPLQNLGNQLNRILKSSSVFFLYLCMLKTSSAMTNRRNLFKALGTCTALAFMSSGVMGQCTVTDDLRSAAGIFSCGMEISYQGYDYQTVEIGGQCWFAENLRASQYTNGDAIANSLNQSEWMSASSGASAIYGEGTEHCTGSFCNETDNENYWGLLYNGYAVLDSRGLCPNGWHVPTIEEFLQLAPYGTTALKAASSGIANISWDGDNSTGFAGLPAGIRKGANSDFNDGGSYAFWWTSTESGDSMRRFVLETGGGPIYTNPTPIGNGHSIRCLLD